jgi:peptidoglycan-N-acetylglucosamine deacetylase
VPRGYVATVYASQLTFDDGPGPDTGTLLDVLARHATKATFFLVGERVAGSRETLARLTHDGHRLGNHSWDHPDLRTLPLRAVQDQLQRTSETIEAASGVRPELFRPPFGYTSVAIEELAESLGMRTALWDVDTRDWARPGTEAIVAAIASAPPRAVMLLHDGPEDRGQTVAAVERWLGMHTRPSGAAEYTARGVGAVGGEPAAGGA